MSRNENKSRPDPRLGRADWVEAAWELLGKGSLDQVRVDTLAKHLDVTRGSFYWHFKDRGDLIEAILERWYASLGFAQSIEPVLHGVADPAARLWTVHEEVIRRIDNGQFAALRLWAKSNPAAQKRLDAEDKVRLDHFAREFRQLGFSAAEAAARAGIYHALVVSEYLRCGTLPLAERLRRARVQHLSLVAAPG